jgi:hypothetical protein
MYPGTTVSCPYKSNRNGTGIPSSFMKAANMIKIRNCHFQCNSISAGDLQLYLAIARSYLCIYLFIYLHLASLFILAASAPNIQRRSIVLICTRPF